MYQQKIATILDTLSFVNRVVLPELHHVHWFKIFDPSMLRLQVQRRHLHIVKTAYLPQNTCFKSFKSKIEEGFLSKFLKSDRSCDLKHHGDKSLDLSSFPMKNLIFQQSIVNIAGSLEFKFLKFCNVHLPLHLQFLYF